MTGKIAISVKNLGKRYRIVSRSDRHKTLRDFISNAAKAPISHIKHMMNFNNRINEQNTFWALKDVSFDVQEGEVVGIIGRNGAGKSTLLKVISRITSPTEGFAEIQGRVGSLLEVGVGFHPELTGRENIYFSGSILGMTKKEIDDKFDEIVRFSEMEKFLDLPSKRYSSGMYVKLGFSVAAHLEPEILLIDEVLAVGDVAFQKKCLEKMNDISKEGRTILFVSHNMNAITDLCHRAILLDAGKICKDGEALEVVTAYLSGANVNPTTDLDDLPHKGTQNYARLKRIVLLNKYNLPTTVFQMKETFCAQIEVESIRYMRNAEVELLISSNFGTRIHYLASTSEGLHEDLNPGKYIFVVKIPEILLFPGKYKIDLRIKREGEDYDDRIDDAAYFDVIKGDTIGLPKMGKYDFAGSEVYTSNSWSLVEKNVT